MAYRNLDEALDARRRALELEQAELEARLKDMGSASERKREVDDELRTLGAQIDGVRSPKRLPLLQRVAISSPCNASWDQMAGDERRRFCKSCSKYVYNLSAMSSDEAEALVYETEGQLCARFFRRADGTVLTSDCPDRQRRRRKRRIMAVAGALGAALAAGIGARAAVASREAEVGRMIVMPAQPAVMGSVAAAPDETTPPARQ